MTDAFTRELMEVSRGLLGPGFNFGPVLAHAPAVLEQYLNCRTALSRAALEAKQRARIALAVAEFLGSNYCLSAHCVSATFLGMSHEEIDGARQGFSSDPQTQALLSFVKALLRQNGAIQDDLFHDLQNNGFTDGDIIEIVANVALNYFENILNISLCTDGKIILFNAEKRRASET